MHLNKSEVSHLGVADDITDLVGGTPVLRLKRLVPAGSADIFAKLEYLNPGGSVKDRAAIGIIRKAEQEGKLAPGGTIVEATAGNTGIGLALIGVNRGYKVKLFVPENFSQEKVIIMRALGAEVERTPDAEGMQGAIRREFPVRRQVACRTQQHGGMSIVPAGMHHPWIGRCIGHAGLFGNRQSVDIGPQADGIVAIAPVNHREHTCPIEGVQGVHAERPQPILNDCAGARFAKPSSGCACRSLRQLISSA